MIKRKLTRLPSASVPPCVEGSLMAFGGLFGGASSLAMFLRFQAEHAVAAAIGVKGVPVLRAAQRYVQSVLP